ncbi:MAG: hypothetical protein AMS21_01750 [Gemmatimonas sp. SG8_38_2]|nr:MAG: hypothetical protein AMS21_01750 [Gemmatimonas sp. SG8_38_2]
MRYSIGLLLALALPHSVAAQTGKQAPAKAAPSIHVQHHLPPQLMLRASYYLYLDVDPLSGTTVSGPPSQSESESKFSLEYQEQKSPEVEEMELRVKRARIGFGVSGGVFLAGFVTGLIYVFGAPLEICLFDDCPPTQWVDRVGWASTALLSAGGVGMITSGAMLGVRKRKLRELRQARDGTSGRAQWDLARSRLVF